MYSLMRIRWLGIGVPCDLRQKRRCELCGKVLISPLAIVQMNGLSTCLPSSLRSRISSKYRRTSSCIIKVFGNMTAPFETVRLSAAR